MHMKELIENNGNSQEAARRDDTAPAPADTTPDSAAPSEPAATTPRHEYTLTVEDVYRMLCDQSVPRDERTIQRWCKSGRLRSIVDEENANRYLIEPTSAHLVVATLVEERRRQDARVGDMPRHDGRHDATAPGNAPTPDYSAPQANADTAPAAHDAPGHDASSAAAHRDDVATDRDARIKELEGELMHARIEAESRKQVITQLKDFYNEELARMGERYDQAIEYALSRSERVGRLETENRMLKELLPPATGQHPPTPQPGFSFTPRSVQQNYGDNPPAPDEGQGV